MTGEKTMSELSVLTDFLDRLDEADIHYTLSSVREGALLVALELSGERWEVEFSGDGDIEVEIFRSDGEVFDFSVTEELFEQDEDA